MPSLSDRFLGALGLQRAISGVPDWWPQMAAGQLVGFPQPITTLSNKSEEIGSSFQSLVGAAYAANPIVFACMNARAQLFSEARFKFQKMKDGKPGELFATPATYLAPLEEPWPGGTTSQLLKDALIDADIAGNAFIYRDGAGLHRLRPDWVTIIAGSPRDDASTWDIDVEVLGYGYQPGGQAAGKERIYLQREQVAHFKSTHDPARRFSGMSWLVPIIREISADQSSTAHKLKYFENAATPNLLVKFDQTMAIKQAKDWIDLFNRDHAGAMNAFKTLFLGGGSDAVAVGGNLRQADFVGVQAAGELRIASAAGVPPIVIGLAGGLEAATYSNYGQARRAFADLTMRPLWRDMAGALEGVISIPAGSRLWYDDRDISFLQEDMQDAAVIQQTQANSIRTMIDAGFTAATVVEAVVAQDFNRLKHSGLFSVQLQAPGSTKMPAGEVPGEVPVGPGTKPEDLPKGAPTTKPVTKASAAAVSGEIRCSSCNRLLAEMASAPYRITCTRCKNVTSSDLTQIAA
jgi:phage portal protein BeeE